MKFLLRVLVAAIALAVATWAVPGIKLLTDGFWPQAGTLLALESAADGPGQTVHRYDLKTRKSDVALAGVNNFQMSSGGDKALYRQGENWMIASLRPMAAAGPAG